MTHWESETESGLHERSDIRTRIFDEFVKNNWPDNDKFQFKNANYNLENVELKKYSRPNHMYPRKMPKKGKVLPKTPLLRLFTEIPRSTLVKKTQIESWIFFKILFSEFYLMIMKFFETVHTTCVFYSFEAIVISSAGCELLLLLLKKNCENISKFRIANFLFQSDSSSQQKFLVPKVIHWLVSQKWSQWFLSTPLYH